MTFEALRAQLRQVDISVPLRSVGRESHHGETWTLCRLLSTLASVGQLQYPISVRHRPRPEPPDFLLEMDGSKIGIEITEAISEGYAKFSALAEKEFPDAMLDPGHFRWGAPALEKDEMRKLLRDGRLTSPGWAGDEPEREWALFIQSTVDKKLEKLARTDFVKFESNWLSIYDNLPLPSVDRERALGFLLPLLSDRWTRRPSFDAVFIERGAAIAKVDPSGFEQLRLLDLWS